MRDQKNSGYWKVAGGVALFGLGVLCGLVLATTPSKAQAGANDAVYQRLGLFAKILNYVETNYVDPISHEQLIYGAIKGMLDSLDPHSVFLPPDVFKELKINTTGEFQGLGLIIDYNADRKEGGFSVQSVLNGSPAAAMGIRRGDRLVRIDGQDLDGRTLQEVVRLLRGPVGSSVTLTMDGVEGRGLRDMVLVRAVVRFSSVESAAYPPVGYIRVKSFQNQTAREVKKAVHQFMAPGSGTDQGIIIDLRDNPGGLLDEAVAIADIFLKDGPIVSVEGRNSLVSEQSNARPEDTFATVPVALVVNGGSASASEVLAGAMKDTSRAAIVGQRTYGKGSVQNIIDLEDGSGLKLTVARYYTPRHRSIQGVGVEPDLEVPDPRDMLLPPDDVRQNLSPKLKAMLEKNPNAGLPKDDWPLQAAYTLVAGSQTK